MARGVEGKARKFVEDEEKLVKYEWNHYRIYLLALTILLTIEFYRSGDLQMFLGNLGGYGYIGGLISGFLFTYGVTTPFAIASFFILAEDLNIWALTLIGSLGGVISEYMIYSLCLKNSGKCICTYNGKKIKLPKIRSEFLKKISPLIAGFIIASPLPDEFVAILLGIEKYRLRDFLLLTFFSKFIGILVIVGIGRIF